VALLSFGEVMATIADLFYPGRVCWGVYDLVEKTWILDCFDSPRLSFTEENAKKWLGLCAEYADGSRYEVRKYVIPGSPNSPNSETDHQTEECKRQPDD